MFDQWDRVQSVYDELSTRLTAGNLDNRTRQLLQRQHSQLAQLLERRAEHVELEKQLQEAQEQSKSSDDAEMRELFEEEIKTLQEELVSSDVEIENLLYPPPAIADRNAYIEIRAGAGGQEASLFAADLAKMYMLYAQKMGWRAEIVSASETDLKGYKEVVIHIKGPQAYGLLQRESGTHRVQRVPATETQGRVHTSTATVAILPEADEQEDFDINPSDLRIDVYRASGAGGQHVNTTDSAVRITHIPSGTVVSCQDERSQHKNKAKAMKMLKSRILLAEQEKQDAEMSAQRKSLVGTGMRAEKVRTYNYPQNRVTDHQVNVTLKKLDMVMQGDLNEIIDALAHKDQEDRKKMPLAILELP